MQTQPGWPGFLAGSSIAGGVLRLLPLSPNLGDEPLTLPCARERCGCPRGTAAHVPPLPSAPGAAYPPSPLRTHSGADGGARRGEQRSCPLEPFSHLSPGADPLTPRAVGCGAPRNPSQLQGLAGCPTLVQTYHNNSVGQCNIPSACTSAVPCFPAHLARLSRERSCFLALRFVSGLASLVAFFDHGESLIS